MNYASRWARLFAWWIDVLVLVIIMAALWAAGLVGADNVDDLTATDRIIPWVVAFGYFVVLTVAFGATLGKMAFGMKVVGADGGKASAGAIIVREIILRGGGSIVGIALGFILGGTLGDFIGGLVFLIVILRILVDDHRQGWHDKIGGTFVVNAK